MARKWIQKATEKMEEKGTVGSFSAWCKRKGHDGATTACIKQGLASKDPAIRKKAQFAANVKSKTGRKNIYGK